MIDLYTWTTPNGRKAAIMLEEVGLAYTVHPVDLSKNEQFAPDFLAISPNNKIPAIVDHEGVDGRHVVFESGAILVYLAEKTGELLPRSGPRRELTLEWLFWSIGGVGPMFGQFGYFALRAEEKTPAAIDRFTDEAVRLIAVMEKRLAETPHLAGEAYSIADVCSYPWVKAILGPLRDKAGDKLSPTPAVDRWLESVGARPAVQRGMAVPKV
jgi:GST-like protein